jgi:hypothetical protein
VLLYTYIGASVAKWLAHLSFTSKAAGSSLSENFLNATRTQSSCEKSKSQRSAESCGFSLGTPVSSHRESWQGGLGKRAHSNWHMLLWWPCPSWQSYLLQIYVNKSESYNLLQIYVNKSESWELQDACMYKKCTTVKWSLN